MFVESEAMNPKVLKLSSLAEHRARPPITGIRESLTRGPVTSPSGKNKKLWNIANNGNLFQIVRLFRKVDFRRVLAN
jgi:hypothetical protein